MRWACILFPQLAMDGVLRASENPEAPLALITGPSQRRVVQAITPAARDLGLRPGMTLTAAKALADGFAMAEYDEQQIQRWHRLLAAWAYRFSSHVSLHYPRALLLEVQSSMALFGPWPAFERRLRSELESMGFRHRIALAPNPAAARILANSHDGIAVADREALQQALGRMSVHRLGWAAESATALSRMGLRHVHQVLALPRATLARRFPEEVMRHLDTLLGSRALVLDCYAPPDVFDVRLELNYDVESNQALFFPLKRLVSDLAAFLAGRDSGVQRFTVHLEHRGQDDTLLPVGLLAAERDAEMLFELTRGRLEPVQLPAPVQAVRLVARDLPRFVPQSAPLFEARPQQTLPWEQLRERLRARLGDESVLELGSYPDHRPEHAWRHGAASTLQSQQPAPPRPGWLMPEPTRLSVAPSAILAGPERIESGWWDGADIRRDYFLVQTDQGQLAWVFRPVGESGPFWLHGWFA
ncbi:MAG: Y-family DNA polymerase [Pseudomonadaceae bacterium]|nr:DNA polymerase Y family protein [Pseudomonas sp.]